MPREIIPVFDPSDLIPAVISIQGTVLEWAPVTLRSEERLAQVGKLAVDDRHAKFPRAIEGTVSIVGPNTFELTMTDHLHERIKDQFGQVRTDFVSLTEKILADPFGPTCIDAFKDTDAGQWARLVHKVEGPLADLIPGKKLAIKGTGLEMRKTREFLEYGGPYRSYLDRQFRSTLELSRLQQAVAPEGIGSCLFVNEVYGILRHAKPESGVQEWMLMEYIDDAESLENIRLASMGGGIGLAFNASDHPDLARMYVEARPYRSDSDGIVDFNDFQEAVMSLLGRRFGRELRDLNGNNILMQHTDKGPRYTIIDVAGTL